MKHDSPADRHTARQTAALPLLAKLHSLAEKYQQQVPPSTLLGKAISYLLSQWSRLVAYCEDGRLSIDNNKTENAIRPFVIGRKNWLFSKSQGGARASAALYGLVETCKTHGLDPYRYLRYVFTTLPNLTSKDNIADLFPWRCADKL